MPAHDDCMREAIRLAGEGMRSGRGGPFGCVVVHKGEVVGRGCNEVTSTNDPTAHAEMVAIRAAGAKLGTFNLAECTLYASCEPCPMCLAAIHWARIPEVYFANTRKDAAAIGFDDDAIGRALANPAGPQSVKLIPILRNEAQVAFQSWKSDPSRVRY